MDPRVKGGETAGKTRDGLQGSRSYLRGLTKPRRRLSRAKPLPKDPFASKDTDSNASLRVDDEISHLLHCYGWSLGDNLELTSLRSSPHKGAMPRTWGWAHFFCAASIVGCSLIPTPAIAGRRPFLLAYDSEIIPEGDVELEQWLWSESKIPARPRIPARYWVYWSPVIALSNHLELYLPVQWVATSTSANLETLSAELRYRIFPREHEGGFQALIHAAIHQAVFFRAAPSSADLGLVATYGSPNQLHLMANFGVQAALPWPEHMARPILLEYAAGAAHPLFSTELRLAVEFDGEIGLRATQETIGRHFLGGAIAWSRGRVWITAGFLFGLTGLSELTPRYMPRLIWAVAF